MLNNYNLTFLILALFFNFKQYNFNFYFYIPFWITSSNFSFTFSIFSSNFFIFSTLENSFLFESRYPLRDAIFTLERNIWRRVERPLKKNKNARHKAKNERGIQSATMRIKMKTPRRGKWLTFALEFKGCRRECIVVGCEKKKASSRFTY